MGECLPQTQFCIFSFTWTFGLKAFSRTGLPCRHFGCCIRSFMRLRFEHNCIHWSRRPTRRRIEEPGAIPMAAGLFLAAVLLNTLRWAQLRSSDEAVRRVWRLDPIAALDQPAPAEAACLSRTTPAARLWAQLHRERCRFLLQTWVAKGHSSRCNRQSEN